MKKLRGIERRISLLSCWIAAFDTVCDAREDEDGMPSNLTAMRKTAQGIMLELENSRHHLHQKLEKTNWERAIDVALQHSINQLPTGDGQADTGEIASLTREAELVKTNFAREANRDVLEQERAGDAAIMQVLLTAQFEILASLSETMDMNEEEVVTHAKSVINRLLDTGFSAASQVVKPDGANMPVEAFPPTKRGTPKRKKMSMLRDSFKPIPNPQLAAMVASQPQQQQQQQQQMFASPVKGTPRRRRAQGSRKGVAFTPVKKKSPSKRVVRWRDDDGESGTLADFEKTPQRFDLTPERASPEKALPRVTAIPLYLSNADSADDDSNTSLITSETSALAASKPNRFQAGFLSKARPATTGGSPAAPAPAPAPATLTTNLTSPPTDTETRASPLRNLDASKASNIGSPRTRLTSVSPRPATSPASSIPIPAASTMATTKVTNTNTTDENNPPCSSSDEEETTSIIDPSKLRFALHASKRRDRLSSMGGGLTGGAGAGFGGGGGGGGARRVSSIGIISHHRPSYSLAGPSPPSHHHYHPLASSTNGISRFRRGSAERRRSPPISCSPPDMSVREARTLTPGQARRMGMGLSSLGGLPRAATGGSPGAGRARDRVVSGGTDGIGGGKARRITIGGAAMTSAATAGGSGAGGTMGREKGSVIWR